MIQKISQETMSSMSTSELMSARTELLNVIHELHVNATRAAAREMISAIEVELSCRE